METIETIPAEKKRPAFLTVLCVLTFIGTGIMLTSSLFQIKDTFFRTAQELIDEQQVKLAQAEAMMPGITDKMSDMILEMAPYRIPGWLIGFLGNLLTLTGAIMMWRLKKIGFFIYVFAELVPFFISIAFMHGLKAMTGAFSAFGSAFESLGIAILILMLIFDFAFIIMYAVNLKHMS